MLTLKMEFLKKKKCKCQIAKIFRGPEPSLPQSSEIPNLGLTPQTGYF